MKPTGWLILLVVLVFVGFVVARLPASWVVPGPQSGLSCGDVYGTVWSGTCSGLVVQRQPVGDLSWDVHASRLLAGQLDADLVLTRPTGASRGNVEVGLNKKIVGHNIQADVPLDPTVVSALPPNLRSLRGAVHADVSLLRFDGKRITALEGLIEARDLTEGEGPNAQHWGSYSLSFPPSTGGDPIGQLKDLGNGPLAVEGSVRLTREPGFDLEGLVAARPTAPPGLAQEIQFLGSPDAQGRRPFSLAMTF